jgi:D-3-phosphoglycerate dehydrogenase
MGDKAKVVLTDYVWESLDVEKKTLDGLAELVPLQTKKPEEFLAQAEDCDALLNTYAGPITAEVMAGMPKCRIIARYGIGVDTIDLDAATQAGIIVTNNPTYCIEEVAEHTMALMLACARKVSVYDRLVRGGRWQHCPAGGGARGSLRHAHSLCRSRCAGRTARHSRQEDGVA